jgi:hypothetical protein
MNTFNLLFSTFFTLFFAFLNVQFQKSFVLLNVQHLYPYYSQQISTIFFVSCLLIFSQNLIISVLLHMIAILSSLFLLYNPDLNDIKKKYAPLFVVGMVSSLTLFIVVSFFSHLSARFNFSLSIDFLQSYWLIPLLFILILATFTWPIYSALREKIFYEDLLPIFVIKFVPFIIINTFVFLKVSIYIFNGSVNKLLFYYTGFFVILLFLISLYFLLRYMKNYRKFVVVFNVSAFLIFLLHLLLVQNLNELLLFFTNFLVLIIVISVNIFTCSSMMFYMLRVSIPEISSLYSKRKKEVRLYFASLLYLILTLTLMFFDLNFYNFNILYFINLLQILLLFFIFLIYVLYSILKYKKEREIKPLSSEEESKIFITPIVLFFTSVFILVIKRPIFNFLINKMK